MRGNIIIYIAVMALVTYLIRCLPLILIRGEIKNKTLKSFLYYVPYVTLAVMTFPAILDATGNIYSGALAFVVAMGIAFAGGGLVPVSIVSCLVVLVCEIVPMILK